MAAGLPLGLRRGGGRGQSAGVVPTRREDSLDTKVESHRTFTSHGMVFV